MAKIDDSKSVISVPVKSTSIFSTRNILVSIGVVVAIIGAVVIFNRKAKISKFVTAI